MIPVFSIVLVSRGRPFLLQNLLDSIKESCLLPYEVLVGLDDDDSTMKNFKDTENVKFFRKPRMSNLHVYLNELASLSTGKYVLGLNDDCEIINKGWDKNSEIVLDKFKPICYGATFDNSIDKVGLADYSSFPVISRTAIQTLGFFMEETCGNHGSDVVTFRIYKESESVCQVPIQIRHIFHENDMMLTARLRDKTAVEMIERTMKENKLSELFTIDVSDYVNKVKAFND